MQAAANILNTLIDIIETHSVSEQLSDKHNSVPFTARLTAYHRWLDVKSPALSKPLLNDTFAEELCGKMDLSLLTAFGKKVETARIDIIFRHYYIEQYLLKPFVEKQNKSNTVHQIVLFGAGLDSRAYRLDFLHSTNTIIFEIDYEVINKYKEYILSKYKQKCGILKRLSIDLSLQNWHKTLIENGFNVNMPTFFVLEGLYYYLTEKDNITLFDEINKLCESKDNNQYEIFVDSFNPTMMRYGDKNKDAFLKDLKFVIPVDELTQYFTNFKWCNVKATDTFYIAEETGVDKDVYITPYMFYFIHANKIQLPHNQN
eukprot:210643_1